VVLESNECIDPEVVERDGFPYAFLLNPVLVLRDPADSVYHDALSRI